MKSILLATTAILALGTAACAQDAATEADESTMAMADVPANVMEAATAANTMGTEFDTVAMDDGVFEFAGKSADGMGYEIDVMEDGSIEEIEKQVAMEALPAAVTAALETNLAGFTPDYIEESTRPDGAIVYEFEGSHDGAAIDAEINADGTNFMMNDDMAG